MKFLKYIPLLFFAFLLLSATPSTKKTLIVAEYDDNAAKNHIQYLVSYTFLDGIMTAKETLLVIPTQKQGVLGDYIRFDLGKNKLYQNRYVVSGIGNIIDLKQKKIILAEKDNFFAFNGDSVIFYTNDIFKGTYYSVFNLRTEQYDKVIDPNYDPAALPDVEVDETTKPFSIAGYFSNGKKEIVLQDAGYGQSINTKETKTIPSPLFWVDKKSFLYASYSQTQDLITIYKINIDKTIDKIGVIETTSAASPPAFFEYALDGSIVYSCAKGRFTIDLMNKKIEKRTQELVGNNFSIESDENPKYGRIVKYNSETIGKKWCRFDNAQSTPEYLSIQNDMVMDEERYHLGVLVWNVATKKWIQIEATSLSNIIGWIE